MIDFSEISWLEYILCTHSVFPFACQLVIRNYAHEIYKMIWKKSHIINSNFAILSLKKKTKQEKTITIYLNRLIRFFCCNKFIFVVVIFH